MRWQAALCTDCDACLDACPRSANPKTATMTVAEVLALLRRDGPLLSGITVSGGEATTQLPFVVALFAAIKASRIWLSSAVCSTATVRWPKPAGSGCCRCSTAPC